MRLLILGGSGHVGSLVVPRLAALGHAITLFDVRPPRFPLPDGASFTAGDITDLGALYQVAPGNEGVLYLAMGRMGYSSGPGDNARSSFEANALGVWLICEAALASGSITRIVYASSLSVYEDCLERPLPDEAAVPPDATNLYGVTKRFGEDSLRAFATRSERLSGFSLRLCFPVETAEDVARCVAEGRDCALTADETASAFHAALTAPEPPGRYAALHIVGSASVPRVGIARAKELLGWEPAPR